MTAPNSSPRPTILLKIPVNPDQPGLLEGLDNWIQLGLISDAQIRQMGQQHFSCRLPEPAPEPAVTPAPTPQLEPLETALLRISTPKPRSSSSPTPSAPIPAPSNAPTPQRPNAPTPQPFFSRLTQSFIENFSITWLLFLGVFMVVLSSVVLAASQWQAVPPAGQYSILLAYTIAFWGAASWTQRQDNLQITALMLRVTTLLIIPVNFWMIDSLGLWQSVLGWGLGIVAAIALSTMTLLLLHPKPSTDQDGVERDRHPQFPPMIAALNTITLSGLHWGWAIPTFPIIATYIGTIGTAILISRYQPGQKAEGRRQKAEGRRQKAESRTGNAPVLAPTPPPVLAPTPPSHSPTPPLPIPLITVAFATFLLVIRANVAANVTWSQLGLAIGLCGWVISWISRTHENQELWMKSGATLLILGWLAPLGTAPPWQSLMVSGLGLWMVGDRFRRSWTRNDLTLLFIIGLQSLWLVQRIVPGRLRQILLDWCIQVSGDQGMPVAIWSLTVFPYVLLTLAVATYLHRQDQFSLGRWADWLALWLGVCLMTVSLLNPVTRSLNITISTLTLAWVFRHRQIIRPGYLHLFHGLAIAALLSWINTIFPTLTSLQWALILTGLAIAEWLLHLRLKNEVLAKSVWYGGLGLGAIAYPLFALTPAHSGCAAWFALPTAMIAVGQRSSRLSAPLAGWLAVFAVFLGQTFIILAPSPEQAWGLGGCAVLMLWATGLTRSIGSAGLGVGFAVLTSWLLPYQLGWLADTPLFYWIMATPALLWLGWTPLQSRSSPLVRLYTRALNGWAIALSGLFMIGFILYTLVLYSYPVILSGGWENGIGYTLLVTGAIAYRFLWHPTHLGLWGLATGLAVLTAQGIMAFYPLLPHAVTLQLPIPHPLTPNLGLALLGWGLVFLVVKPLIPERFSLDPSRHLISLLYGILGSVLILAKFNSTSLTPPITDLAPLWYPTAAILVLWGMRWWSGKQSAYRWFAVTTDGAAIGLITLNGVIVLDAIAWWYVDEAVPTPTLISFGGLMLLLLGAIAFRQRQQSTEVGTIGLAATVGLLVAGVIPWLGGGRMDLAIALLILGLLTQLLGDWLVRQWHRPYRLSFHLIPLAYGSIGWLLSQVDFTATTGVYTLAVSLIGIGVGRRQLNFKPLTVFSLAGTSLAAYQLLFYQMQQASGGQAGDGMMLLGGLAIALAIVYVVTTLERLGSGFRAYLCLTTSELAALGHLHWFLSNGFLFLALFLPRSPTGHTLGIALFAGLATYALTLGNTHFHFLTHPPDHPPTHRAWTTLGLLELLATIAYGTYQLAPHAVVWGHWLGAIATLTAVGLKLFPWEPWGWCPRPGHRTASVLPIGTLLLSAWATNIPSILLVAAFYAWFAYQTDRIRLSYLSVFCIGWAVLWFLQRQQWEQVIWMALDIGGAVLYVIQVDPQLRSPDQRNIRHNLRLITTGIIGYVSVAESLNNPWIGIFTLVLSLGLLLAGIGLRTRAYLYVGTGTLLFEVLRYTRRFIGQHPLQIWAVGIILGLGFIWVAATFEARRNQVNAMLSYWRTELDSWE